MNALGSPGQGSSFPDKTGRALARLAYAFIVLALIALPLALVAAASGHAVPAWFAGTSCAVLLIAAVVSWRWQARRKLRTHPDTKDRQGCDVHVLPAPI
ncbi:hypothetical protein HT102_08145 [Hoyosella sp. G463]|uniref:Uncharacterized protein n=1 Tax=Lolliginicoccus lacisalsi TaxID=2742202 RepID=A0A927PMF7_9ACTN|nr:hypothetical protein [Lolliginicoccus lacisalsi]MBD8506452.1 hypothetical protein [Lolliginicoccus lacisalsi]